MATTRYLFVQFFLPAENPFYSAVAKFAAELARYDIEIILFTASDAESIHGIRNVTHPARLDTTPSDDLGAPADLEPDSDLAILHSLASTGHPPDSAAVNTMHTFWAEWLDRMRPIGVFVAEQNIPASQILVESCRARRLHYWHLCKGVFENTWQIDPCGFLRENSMSMAPSLALDRRDLDFAYRFAQIKDYFLGQRHSHYTHINHDLPPSFARENEGRRLILLLGGGDSTRIQWPGQHGSVSPAFAQTSDMVDWFCNAARDLPADCKIVFKNHPSDKSDYGHLSEFGIERLPNADFRQLVELSDCVVSISTIIQYECLLLGKPQVLVGHSGLSGKGLAYEAFRDRDLPNALSACLARSGFPAICERAQAFVERLANLYLIGTKDGMPCRFGLADLAEFITQFKQLTLPPETTSDGGIEFDRAKHRLDIYRGQEDRSAAAKRRDKETARSARKIEKLEAGLQKTLEENRNLRDAIERWNGKSFFRRALHKIRSPKTKEP